MHVMFIMVVIVITDIMAMLSEYLYCLNDSNGYNGSDDHNA